MKIILTILTMFHLYHPVSIPHWHRATQVECNAESFRELVEMNKAGWYGDPPIDMGMASFDGRSGGSISPCGYADNAKPPNFRPRYICFRDSREIEVTTEEAAYHCMGFTDIR